MSLEPFVLAFGAWVAVAMLVVVVVDRGRRAKAFFWCSLGFLLLLAFSEVCLQLTRPIVDESAAFDMGPLMWWSALLFAQVALILVYFTIYHGTLLETILLVAPHKDRTARERIQAALEADRLILITEVAEHLTKKQLAKGFLLGLGIAVVTIIHGRLQFTVYPDASFGFRYLIAGAYVVTGLAIYYLGVWWIIASE